MPPSKDYEKFNHQVTGDVHQAAFSAQSLEKKNTSHKVRIRESCIPELIPNHASLEIEQIQFHQLKFGDIVLVRDKKEIVLRRFVRYEVRGMNEVIIHVVNQHWKVHEEYKDSALSGRVILIEVKGEYCDPYKKEKFGKRLKNRLTHFGTSTPMSRLMETLKFLGGMVGRKKH